MRNRVEVLRQVGVNDIGVAPANQPVYLLDRVGRTATGPVAIGSIVKVRLEDRFQHELGGGLSHPIPYRRHAPIELHSVATDLWDRLKSPTRFIHYEGSGLLF
jgi:hypothetical protein